MSDNHKAHQIIYQLQKEPDTIEFLGANRAVSFNEKMFTEIMNSNDPADIKSYRVLGSIKYSEFIKKLPKDKYHFIDASYIVVDGLSREEIENLLKN